MSIKEYLDGHRMGFTNPLRLLLVTGTVVTILTAETRLFYIAGSGEIVPSFLPDADGYFLYSTTYFAFFTFTAIPLFALFSWLLFRSSGRGYVENLIANLYIATGQFLVLLILFPLFYISKEVFNGFYGPANSLYNMWALVALFSAFNWRGWLLSLLAVTLPLYLAMTFNHGLYLLSPKTLWLFLDEVFSLT